MKKINCCLLFLLFIVSFKIGAQDTIRVPLHYATIQAALSAAHANTTVLVSPGTYIENLEWPSSFRGIKLIGEKGRDSTIIDGNQSGSVITRSHGLLDTNAVIQGFTIRNGSSADHGGGINIFGPGTRLKDLIITDNKCTNYSSGGGVYLTDYTGIIENCIIRNNSAYSFFASNGGGMYISTSGNVDIRNCQFQNNSCGGQSTNSANGAGLWVSMGATRILTIENCVFSGNKNEDDIWTRGGGLYVEGGTVLMDSCRFSSNSCKTATHSYGGGIYSEAINFTLKNSEMRFNRADSSHAIRIYDTAPTTNVLLNCFISENQIPNQFTRPVIELRSPSSSLEMQNCVVGKNTALGIYVDNKAFAKSSLLLNHCTIANNFGGGVNVRNTNVNITNSILQNGIGEITLNGTQTVKVNSSLVKGGYAGGGNIDADAMFDNFFELNPLQGSPCLGAANPAYAPDADIYGNPRPQPAYTLPDMGAIEINQLLSYADVFFFYDVNENGIRDSTERFNEIGGVQVNQQIYSNFRKEGLRIYLDTGVVSLQFDTAFYDRWKVTNQESYQFHIDTTASSRVIEFGMAPLDDKIVVNTFLTSSALRCNEHASLHLSLTNEFAPIEDKLLWLQLDDRITNFSFPIPPDSIESEHLVGWKINELYPAESVHFETSITVPPIGGNVQLGDHFIFKAWLEEEKKDSLTVYEPEIRCAIDPNDKLVSPDRPDSLALFGEPLLYTIRFQNTGNDYARNVVVVDTLDAGLDISTFRLIHTSHPEHILVEIQDRIIRFVFDNIFLLDSTANFDASQGHVAFSIKALPGEEPITIKNKASIYFDFNDGIVTNTTSNQMVTSFTIVSSDEPTNSNQVAVYPNPSKGQLHFSKEVDRVDIFDLNGKLLKNGRHISKLEMNVAPGSILLLRIVYNGKTEMHKIIFVN